MIAAAAARGNFISPCHRPTDRRLVRKQVRYEERGTRKRARGCGIHCGGGGETIVKRQKVLCLGADFPSETEMAMATAPAATTTAIAATTTPGFFEARAQPASSPRDSERA